MYVNFKIAEKFNGKCNLRFDDTNPAKEDEEFVEAIQEDIRWMGFEWNKLTFGSEYFDICYEKAVLLIKRAWHMFAICQKTRYANTGELSQSPA